MTTYHVLDKVMVFRRIDGLRLEKSATSSKSTSAKLKPAAKRENKGLAVMTDLGVSHLRNTISMVIPR
jgi:hypothetical protein